MDEITTQNRNKDAFIYLFSKAIERAAYYGVRALIVLYMISETINMDSADALSIYAWFTSLIIVSQVAGAILGDLALGNKKSIIFGGVIQAFGAFCLCIPATYGLYLGLLLIIIGGGLYSPNLAANFGKLYFYKKRLLDSAYGMYYLAVNIGAFFGIMSIGYFSEEYGWNTGFILAGVLMLLSILPILGLGADRKRYEKEPNITSESRALNIIITVMLAAVFWAFYEVSGFRLTTLQGNLMDTSTLDLPRIIWTNFQFVGLFPILIILAVLWAYYYNRYQVKLLLGFLFGAAGYAALLLIPEIPDGQHVYLYFTCLLFLVLSEAHIAPIVNAVVARYANPKYMAIVFSLILIPSRLGSILIWVFNEPIYNNPIWMLTISMLIMLLIGIGIGAFLLMRKNRPSGMQNA